MDTQPDQVAQTPLRDMAYHYEPYWDGQVGEQLKTVLLFFDGIAVTVPDYMNDAPIAADPVLAEPLADQGLLVQLSPENLLDEIAAETIAASIEELLVAGAFDHVGKHHRFAELSMSRLGYSANARLSADIVEKLRGLGLARASEDGVSVPLHPVVRAGSRCFHSF
jgi:hypothetical protein